MEVPVWFISFLLFYLEKLIDILQTTNKKPKIELNETPHIKKRISNILLFSLKIVTGIFDHLTHLNRNMKANV